VAGEDFRLEARLALGLPASENIHTASAESVYLIAMATRGCRLVMDLLPGSPASRVRRVVRVLVLLVKTWRASREESHYANHRSP
jgi:hypothetical protein